MGHDHDHSAPPTDHNRAFALGIALNLGFVAVEAGYGFHANSLALLADAGHNLSDVLGLALAWGASILVMRGPTARRTYGLRRSSILAALANALFLLIAVGGIVWEAVQRLRSPEPIASGTVMLVAGIGIVINTVTALLFLRGRSKDLNIRGAFLHMAADAAVSAGVVVAALVTQRTGALWIDPVTGLVIATVITVGTWGLLRDSVDLAMDAVPPGIDPSAVEAYLAGLPGVTKVHDLHIWGMSTTHVALTAHLVRPGSTNDDKMLSETSHQLHHRFGIEHVTLQVERDEAVASCELGDGQRI